MPPADTATATASTAEPADERPTPLGTVLVTGAASGLGAAVAGAVAAAGGGGNGSTRRGSSGAVARVSCSSRDGAVGSATSRLPRVR